MNLAISPLNLVLLLGGAAAYFVMFYFVDRSMSGGPRVAFRYVAVLGALVAVVYGLGRLDDYERALGFGKAVIAIVAAGCVFYEQHREGMRRPVSERWKRFVGIALGIAAIISYFHIFRFGYAKYYHRWDQYHYYMGAKYFREMGYDGLYKCTVIAQDELGLVTVPDEENPKRVIRLDMAKEVRHADKKIRNLGGDNLLMPVTDVLAQPEACKQHFSEARWSEYKRDVQFFRLSSDKQYWEDMQKDHGFNPPPVWSIAGYAFSAMFDAGHSFTMPLIGKVIWLQVIAMLDVAYLTAMFAALWWAFGWRVFAVAAIFWGCQGSAPFYWTGGAFLRQDWLFWLVFAACLARKRWFAAAGASLVYAGLLRVFPGLVVFGWLVVAGAYLVKHKRMAKHHQKMLLGGVVAAAVLIGASIKMFGKDSYRDFYRHTLQVHDKTPLTNHMGLRVLVAHKIGVGAESGRMQYTKDLRLTDPFEVWKWMRNERYHKYRFVAYGIIALSLAYFAWVVQRVRSMWIAQCLGQIFIILMSQLTSYYYSFLILTAPLTKVKRQIEAPLFAFAALTQFVYWALGYNDDKYTALTLLSLLFCLGLLCAFMPADARKKLLGTFGFGKKGEAVAAGAGRFEDKED